MAAKLRRNWKRLLVSQMGARHGNSMSAILLGEKSELDAQMKALYQKSGIGHILAISGLHMSFIGIGLYRILRKIGIPFLPAGLIGITFLLLYTCMIGSGVSSQRALVMFAVRVGADMSGRDYDLPTSLAFAAAVIVFCQPLYLFDAGFFIIVRCASRHRSCGTGVEDLFGCPGISSRRNCDPSRSASDPFILLLRNTDLFASFKSGGDPADVFRVGSRDLRKPCGAFRYADRKSSSFYM